MDSPTGTKSNGSNMWPYIVVGSAIGGAVGYLLITESGRKMRQTVHPNDLAGNVENAGHFIERKARLLTEQVHGVLDKAKRGIDEGERAYREAERKYQLRAGKIEGKSNEIAAGLHETVDNFRRSAVTVEKSVLDPICELSALYRGIERGIRFLLGKGGSGATPLYPDARIPAAERRA